MHRVLLVGSGKIGRMVAKFLSGTDDYEVRVGDVDVHSLQRIRQQSGVEMCWTPPAGKTWRRR